MPEHDEKQSLVPSENTGKYKRKMATVLSPRGVMDNSTILYKHRKVRLENSRRNLTRAMPLPQKGAQAPTHSMNKAVYC